MSETNDSENVILYDTSTYLKWTSEINLSKVIYFQFPDSK